MIHPRLIPCLLLKHGLLVRSGGFKVHQVIGNPMSTIMRLSNWNVDELILLDISGGQEHDLRRDDLHQQYKGTSALDVLRAVAPVCFMPLTFGGHVATLEDIRLRLAAGADKCMINTRAAADPSLVEKAAKRFGSQCIVIGIDVKKNEDGRYEVFTEHGTKPTGLVPSEWAAEVEKRGAGEIFLNSIDRDGAAEGYDLDLIRSVTAVTSVPVIACGGVGDYGDFAPGILEGNADAIAAANIFHFFELSYPIAKTSCVDAGIPMRPVKLGSRWFPREPNYEAGEAAAKVAQRLEAVPPKGQPERNQMRWCTRCVYPSISAAPLEFDSAGVCTGCRVSEAKEKITADEWDQRRLLLREILGRYRSRSGDRYDCVIAVSGGKDSYFQTHVIKNEFGLNPLLVTYNGNNYTDAGWHNVHRMKEVFDVDHIFYSPSVKLLKKLNRLGFLVMGDMNWHAHIGITTLPVRFAVHLGIPVVIWGEHGYLDLSGQFSMYDFPEMSYRDRLEHFARGYEWNFFAGTEGITAADMLPYQYPTDQELYELDVRGIYLGNYVYWDANEHAQRMIDEYGFQIATEPFDRTYRRVSNLDDMHENGVHDYLKYIKFGYGRCTDHACKDIRSGRMSRDEGIRRIREMDHVKPSDLARWLGYVDMTESDFDRIADTFRDPRVWRKANGEWVKDNIWDGDCG